MTLPILTYTQHSWPLSSEDSLMCHTYCDTGQPITSDTHTCCRAFDSGALTSCFIDLQVRLSRSRSRTPYLPTTPPRRLKNCADVFVFLLMYICIRYNVSFFLYTAYRLLLYHLSKQNIWSAHIWENTLYVEDAKKQCKYVSLVSSWSFLLFRFYGLNLILFFFISKIIIR